MEKMVDILKKAAVKGELGVEIELEGRNLPDRVVGPWKAVGDNSLRDGVEYVLRYPLGLADIPEALDKLVENLEEEGAKVEYSFRTSVHVHLNVQQYTYPQLLNLIYTYLLIEAPMMEYCGESRKNNRFCLRLADAEYFIDVIRGLFSNGSDAIMHIPDNKIRYASINLEALKKFGSVEFRGLRGTCDKDIIVNWCTALSELGEFAKSCKDPKEVYEIFTSHTSEEFFRKVIRSNPDIFLIKDFNNEFQQSFSLSLDLPFSYKEVVNTLKEEDRAVPVVPKRPRPPPAARRIYAHDLRNAVAPEFNEVVIPMVPDADGVFLKERALKHEKLLREMAKNIKKKDQVVIMDGIVDFDREEVLNEAMPVRGA